MDLCTALKSNESAIHFPNLSSWLKVRRTSKLDGSDTYSGTAHAWLALQTELSKTRRGSFRSAVTMLSLPMAEPSGQARETAVRSPAKGLTQPCSISWARSCCSNSGFLEERQHVLQGGDRPPQLHLQVYLVHVGPGKVASHMSGYPASVHPRLRCLSRSNASRSTVWCCGCAQCLRSATASRVAPALCGQVPLLRQRHRLRHKLVGRRTA